MKGKDLDWGYAQWAKPLLNIMMDGSMGVTDYQCRKILGKSYHRLSPVFPPETRIALDDVKAIPELVRIAEETDIRQAARWIRKSR